MSLDVQFMTLGMMFAGGLALGALYDLYRVLTDRLRVPTWLLAVLDIIYWLVGTALVFRMLYSSNNGQVRLFVFVGLAVGIIFYFSTLSRMTIRIICFMIKVILTSIRIGRTLIDWFVVTPILFLYRCLIVLFGFVMALSLFTYKVVLQLLYPFWKIFVWIVSPLVKWAKSWRWLQACVRTTLRWWSLLFGGPKP